MGITIRNNNSNNKFQLSGTNGGFKSYYYYPTLLLDAYPSASAAYSLRKLNSSYSGSAIRVRRTSDNTEQDIGFVNNQLDTSSLTTFVGSSSGFVTRWYDQSGNNKNATQTTAANQPRIINSGSIYLLNNKPSIYFSITGEGLILSSYFSGSAGTLFRVQKNDQDPPSSIAGAPIDNVGTYVNFDFSLYPYTDGTVYEKFATNTRKNMGNPSYNLTIPNLFTVVSDTGLYDARINGGQLYTTTTNTVAYSNTQFPAIGKSYLGLVSEIIVYTANKINIRESIESNINTHYNLYNTGIPAFPWKGNETALLDIYPSASSAYSLRNLSSTYKGPLIRVRRSSDNMEMNVYGNDIGQLDEESMLNFATSNSLYVTRWYDQNNNARDAWQFTSTSQPLIVQSGSISKINSRPAIVFTGASPLTLLTNFPTASAGTKIHVSRTHADPPGQFGFNGNVFDNVGTAQFGGLYPYYDGNIYDEFATTTRHTVGNPAFPLTNINLYNSVSDAGLFRSFLNDSQIFTTATNTVGYKTAGAIIGNTFSGSILEIVIYQSNQSSSLSAINNNINSYYRIY